MSVVVVDAGVVLRWLLVDEPDREPALPVRDRIQAGRLEPRQPSHFPMEVASALVAAARVGRLDRVDPHDFASAVVETALDLGLRVPDTASCLSGCLRTVAIVE